MDCSYCGAILKYNRKTKVLYCPKELKQATKNPMVNNQMLCLPFLQFAATYPEVLARRKFKIFNQIGYDCVSCGMIGSHIVWWREFTGRQADHWDIAGYKEAKLCKITIDHIYPKSKGGSNTIDNYQPMCGPCNGRKSDKIVG